MQALYVAGAHAYRARAKRQQIEQSQIEQTILHGVRTLLVCSLRDGEQMKMQQSSGPARHVILIWLNTCSGWNNLRSAALCAADENTSAFQ